MKEQVKIVLSDDVSIEIRYTEGDILVWDRGTGYGQSSTFDALEKVKGLVGHTQVKSITTVRTASH